MRKPLRSGSSARMLRGMRRTATATAVEDEHVIVVEAGEQIPCSGIVIDGIATVDESAITGESAPVIRESGEDRSAVTAGTLVKSGRIVVAVR